MEFIDFYITTYNTKTTQVIESVLTKMQDYGDVKNWKFKEEDSDTLHYAVVGSWGAYSTISAIGKSKGKKGPDSILFSLEHFEED